MPFKSSTKLLMLVYVLLRSFEVEEKLLTLHIKFGCHSEIYEIMFVFSLMYYFQFTWQFNEKIEYKT